MIHSFVGATAHTGRPAFSADGTRRRKATAEFFWEKSAPREAFRRGGERDYAAAACLRRRRVHARAKLSFMAARYSGGAEGGQEGSPPRSPSRCSGDRPSPASRREG